jgi:hypothetical protein
VRLAVLLLLTGGCRQIFGLDTPDPLRGDGGNKIDGADGQGASVDGATDLCFSRPSLGLGACLAALPMNDFSVSASTTIDTGTFALCATLTTSTQDLCVVAAKSIAIGSGTVIRVIGARPLVLFSPTMIEIDGTLDVASHIGGGMPTSGAGENPPACGATQGGAMQGGGAGGSFGSRGGNGGKGADNNSMPGQAQLALPITAFHGGCRGGIGADGIAQAAYGGGAVAMFAPTISINGTINASGMAGPGAVISSKGGYGGASGGMLVLSAPSVMLGTQGEMLANGGAGGGGSSSSVAGANGGEATTFSSTITGGQGGNNGDGGNAYPFVENGQDGAGGAGAGGGGAGGAGAIVIFTETPFSGPVRISPMAQLPGF